MGVIIKTDKRRVIPRWRSFELASFTGELRYTQKLENDSFFQLDSPLKEQQNSWETKKDLGHAGDLLSSAYVLGIENQFKDAAEFVLANETDTSTPLYKLAFKIADQINQNVDTAEIANILIQENFESHDNEIKKYRAYLKREPKNPIAWIELGRIYSVLGLTAKAQKCIDIGLSLDKDNRFIVRSASRFYQHFHGDEDYALQIIKRSSYANTDPWLISAEIAYSSILQRHSKMAKIGMRYIDDHKHDAVSITELASAIGTLEFSNGQFKEARKYFSKSLVHPNDNSLAQVNWIFDDLPGFSLDMSKYNTLPLAFEAKAIDSYHKQQFKDSFSHAIRWYKDEPYSSRPINFASYISGLFLNDYTQAIDLVKKGLVANPKDPMLSNNLVYFLIENKQEDEAFKAFNTLLKRGFENMNDPAKVTLTATTGLILFRMNELQKGRELYQKAIELSKKTKSKYLIALATAHYIREEIRATENASELTKWKAQLDSVCKNMEEPDLNVIYNKVSKEYESKVKGITTE